MRGRPFVAVVAATVIVTACSGGGSAAPDPQPTSSGLPPITTEPGATGPIGSESSAPVTESTGEGAPGRRPEGFGLIAAEVALPDGSICELCLWLADTDDRRQRGLMGVTDLAGADGMAFTYDTPSTGAFWMRGTPMPLSIAFFGADGVWVSASDMAPCLDGPPEACERYPSSGPFTTAVEVPAGRFEELGIGAGSRFAVLGPVDACP